MFASEAFGKPVYSCELNKFNYLLSRILTFGARNLSLGKESSPVFLKKLLRMGAAGDNPFFYLDAHWYDYLPLKDELRVIDSFCSRACVVIDDFFVPGLPSFGFDQYQNVRLDSTLVRKAMPGDLTIYYPNYDPSLETGDRRGYCIITKNQPSFPIRSPFTLLVKTQITE